MDDLAIAQRGVAEAEAAVEEARRNVTKAKKALDDWTEKNPSYTGEEPAYKTRVAALDEREAALTKSEATLDKRVSYRLGLIGAAMDIDESANMSDFWNSLSSVAPVDNCLTFDPAPTFCAEIPKQFFIRKCYPRMFQLIWEKALYGINSMEERGTSGFAITGNPGIGKSVFLFYVMWRAVLRRQITLISQYLNSPATWYLTDALPNGPSAVGAITVVVAPPARKHYKQFLKYTKTTRLFYLPVWDLEELLAARAMYELSPAIVEERFNLIGGIARFVFEKPNLIHRTIKEALGGLNIDKFRNMVGGYLSEEDEISYLIIHFVISDDYHVDSLQFASKYIVEGLSSRRGSLFESLSHRQLSNEGRFLIRSLDNTAASVDSILG
ncbi:hypothetical protein CcCBS67573_g08731 [Chytriomyces confervae]|uniref:Uncharacterized protein n=1 Tax=Chytriomyces confervae TaxID=246404 RepID=A0A507EHC8_9FUNG|nr:hypothetical protein CcCBS67573_g08731 [Chytriomyces confervae]